MIEQPQNLPPPVSVGEDLYEMNEKEALEHYAIHNFVVAFNDATGKKQLEFRELRKPPEPDGICLFEGIEISIEVAHLYGTQIDAEVILGRGRRLPRTAKEMTNNRLCPLNLRLLHALNKILANKALKSYTADRVWLLVRNGFPLWNNGDFMSYSDRIHVPKYHPFEQIWLLCNNAGRSGILRLF